MASERGQASLSCSRCDHIEWWRGNQMILGNPARKSDGWNGGPAEWTCNYCGQPVIRPSPMQEALERLPLSDQRLRAGRRRSRP
jgi:hypothetical protein